MALLNVVQIFRHKLIIANTCLLPKNTYAVGVGGALGKLKRPKGKGIGTAQEKIKLPVETDAHRLVNYVCGSNILKEGGEDVKIKPDSEYPDWLWEINIGPPKTLDELDPNTKAYWRKLRKMSLVENNKKIKYRILGPV
ncbi:39S ribosomal protein L54, mitochondrial [Microplitis mediator]|uniref:39S ribosomal protein L54, mitochondrial n=1 Tax=Microplitis mediator TaxID=375433 RepID=UPI0025552BDA|nr:39S ribosomal protein L54, mitochondrial [Microplitis mediator]